jgi:hypothetical protein
MKRLGCEQGQCGHINVGDMKDELYELSQAGVQSYLAIALVAHRGGADLRLRYPQRLGVGDAHIPSGPPSPEHPGPGQPPKVGFDLGGKPDVR